MLSLEKQRAQFVGPLIDSLASTVRSRTHAHPHTHTRAARKQLPLHCDSPPGERRAGGTMRPIQPGCPARRPAQLGSASGTGHVALSVGRAGLPVRRAMKAGRGGEGSSLLALGAGHAPGGGAFHICDCHIQQCGQVQPCPQQFAPAGALHPSAAQLADRTPSIHPPTRSRLARLPAPRSPPSCPCLHSAHDQLPCAVQQSGPGSSRRRNDFVIDAEVAETNRHCLVDLSSNMMGEIVQRLAELLQETVATKHVCSVGAAVGGGLGEDVMVEGSGEGGNLQCVGRRRVGRWGWRMTIRVECSPLSPHLAAQLPQTADESMRVAVAESQKILLETLSECFQRQWEDLVGWMDPGFGENMNHSHHNLLRFPSLVFVVGHGLACTRPRAGQVCGQPGQGGRRRRDVSKVIPKTPCC